jgi:two-component system sensor histidine kinase/response regulator
MGDRALFARVLERFRAEYHGAAIAVRSALAARDFTLSVRLAHTLKGAAGMIEARSLHRCALALEQALRTAQDDSAVYLEPMEIELERVVHEIDRLLAAAAGAPVEPSVPRGGDVVLRLRKLLDAGDGAACDIVRGERGALRAALGEERLGEVAAAVESFDFELASRLLGAPGG